jgi:putative transposase
MEEKLRFVFAYEQHEETMRELCQSFGISRETGYLWRGDTRSKG